jgi:hypothetical protein
MTPDQTARQLVRALLDGTPLPAAAQPDACGRYAAVVQALLQAHAQGGQPAVQRAFVALARQDPALVALAAGDDASVKTVWSVSELYAADFPPPRSAVPDLLPAGLTILAGRPKLGKSWLALQIAIAVATGGDVLGQRAAPGPVLYLALEDTPRRLKDRLAKQGAPAAASVTFHTQWAALSQEGLADLMVACAQGYRLVVVDTLSRGMGRADPLDAVDMVLLLGGLQRLAARYDLALLLIDHHRKPNASVGDAVDDILGSTAKAGVVDAALGLYKVRGEQEAVLKVTGRDIVERELALRWQAERCVWEVQGEAQEVERTARQQEILDALALLGRGTVRDIAEASGQERGNAFRRLQALVKAGAVMRSEEQGQVTYVIAQADLL